MGDAGIRQAEREQFLSLEARVAFIAQKVRERRYGRGRVRLAAYLGDPAAASFAAQSDWDWPLPAYADPSDDPARWLEGLARWGSEPIERAVTVATRWSCELTETREQLEARRAIRIALHAGISREHLAIRVPPFRGSVALEAVEAWLEGGREGDVVEIVRLASAHESERYQPRDPLPSVRSLARFLSSDESAWPVQTGLFEGLIACHRAGRYGTHGRRRLWANLRRRIRDELVPWVLAGEG